MTREDRLEEIRELYQEAASEDAWDVEGPMLFTFYYVGEDLDKLEQLGNELAENDFIFVDIFQLGDEDTDEPTGEYMLQLDKIASYTPDTLADQLEELDKYGQKYGIEALDGWEFGEADDEIDEEETESDEASA